MMKIVIEGSNEEISRFIKSTFNNLDVQSLTQVLDSRNEYLINEMQNSIRR